MCHGINARPPVYGRAITAVTSSPVPVTAVDGNRFMGYEARPAASRGVGVLVLPDNGGLSSFYEQIAIRLAELGHPALAIDCFGRTAGTDYRKRGDRLSDFAVLGPHLAALTREGVANDLLAGINRLRSFDAAGADRVVSLGFCMGGRFAWYAAGERLGLAGAIGLYGYPDPLNGAPGPTQLADGFTAPILAMFGGADEGIPPDVIARFDEALTSAGVEHEVVTYPGAPNGFFESGRPEHAVVAADAWRRIVLFLEERAHG